MAAFSRGPDDVTARISDVIEHLQSDAVQERAEEQTLLLLKELNRLLTFSDDPVKGEGGRLVNHAVQAGMNRVKLARLRDIVREARADILSGDRALALKRFKQAREYWMTTGTKG
jgi:ethanolamine utilization cobalamin adenosyltransferase